MKSMARISALVVMMLVAMSARSQLCVPSSTQTCTTNLKFAMPDFQSQGWDVPLNNNALLLDQYLSGTTAIPGLSVSGELLASGDLDAPNLNDIIFVDGVKYTTIAQAQAACAAYTGAAGNSCAIVAPPGAACGEPSQLPDNIVLFDYRNCAQSQGIRFNLSAAVTGNVRSKWYVQDNYNASTIGIGPTKSAVSAYINSYVDQPEATNGTIAAFNGTMNVNSQQANMTAGAVVGIEGSGQAGDLTAFSVADLRGGTFNETITGQSSATRMVGVYGQKCINTGTGTVTNCASGYFELPSAGTTINRAAHFEGETSIGGTLASPRIVFDHGANGLLTTYNSIPTVGNGIPAQYATVDLTAQGASISATTLYTTPAAGMYRVSCYIVVTQAATTSSTLPACNVTWGDQQTNVGLTQALTATSTGNTTSTFAQASAFISVHSGSNVQYSTTGYATSGATSMQYAVHIRLEAL